MIGTAASLFIKSITASIKQVLTKCIALSLTIYDQSFEIPFKLAHSGPQFDLVLFEKVRFMREKFTIVKPGFQSADTKNNLVFFFVNNFF